MPCQKGEIRVCSQSQQLVSANCLEVKTKLALGFSGNRICPRKAPKNRHKFFMKTLWSWLCEIF